MRRMLEAVSPKDGWQSGIVGTARATFGAADRSAPPVALVGDVVVAMDGRFYDRPRGAVPGDLQLFAERYAQYGFVDALAGVDGAFAVALYDPSSDTLWLARDRFGSVPLYYTDRGGALAFASRPRSLWKSPGASRRPRREYLALVAAGHYRYFDHRPDASPYEGIAQLPAAHVLRCHGGEITVRPYWTFEAWPELREDEATLAERYRDLLLDSVRVRLASADRPAFTLSGGMDSSSVLACAARIAGAPVTAFSVVYDDPTFDERRDIEPMIDGIVDEWHPVTIGTPDVFGLVRRMIEAHDEPVATATWLSHLLLCEEAARRGFRTLFGGLGGDELNAGEYDHFLYHFADLRACGREDELCHEVAAWIRHHDHPVFRKSWETVEAGFASLVDVRTAGRCLPDRRRIERYASALLPEFFRLEEFQPSMEGPFDSYLRNRSYHDMVRETLPCCLRAQDRNGSMFGIEHVLPFLDPRLIELMFRVPGEMKIRDGVTKFLLREAMRGILPEATRTRVKKTGWNAPAHRWFAGKGAEQLLDLVRSRGFRERGIYDVAEVERLVREHDLIVRSGEPREDHMMFLWQVLNVELWLQYLDSPA